MDHRVHDLRSLAMHKIIVARLLDNPHLLIENARKRIDWLQEQGTLHVVYAQRWRALLKEPLTTLTQKLLQDGEYMTAMRHVTPFSGIVTQEERMKILQQFPSTMKFPKS